MLDRFSGVEGRRRLRDALSRQSAVHGSLDVAESLAACCELRLIDAGAVLIEQGASDNNICFIVTGSFAIIVNGRELARRHAEQHVGEMALVDPKARRSATVVALEPSVVALVSEPDFAAIADSNPSLWKNLAVELGDRLRQRNTFVRQRNELPHVFVGSSVESLDVANGVQARLARNPFVLSVWTNDVFGPSQFAIEALERVAAESDFAILVLGPDDRVTSRHHQNLVPRDNVILELGLFIGALGHERVFLLTPKSVNIKIPTDVLGVMPVAYSVDTRIDLLKRLKDPCLKLREAISALGPR
jgi:predicted nucleotide-binding protein